MQLFLILVLGLIVYANYLIVKTIIGGTKAITKETKKACRALSDRLRKK